MGVVEDPMTTYEAEKLLFSHFHDLTSLKWRRAPEQDRYSYKYGHQLAYDLFYTKTTNPYSPSVIDIHDCLEAAGFNIHIVEQVFTRTISRSPLWE